MYKAMIIDDEPVVRWGIRDLIDWEAEGFCLCEDGKDGRDGLAKLLLNVPDLVLVDIKMPGQNGLELISAAKEAGFYGYFIILTGYSEFEFAKSAISLGVEEYLLKPIDEEELSLSVRKVKGKLQRREEEARRQIANESAFREEVLRKILLNLEGRESLKQQMEQCKISFENGIFCAAILAERGGMAPEGSGIFTGKMGEFLRDTTLYFHKTMIDNKIVLIQSGVDGRKWAQVLAKRNERIREKYGNALLVAVGNNVGNWYDLCFSYEFAKFMLDQEFLLGQCDVLSIRTIEEQQMKAENPPAEYFVMLIEVGDLEGIQNSVEKFKTYCIRHLMKETKIKMQVFGNLTAICASIEKKYNVRAGDLMKFGEELGHAQQLESMMELYAKILKELCIKIGRDGLDTVVKRMYYYMEKNYGQEMKLESFAKMFNYNANYLGKIFRREKGDSFNNVLDSLRIANAKRLLVETDLKIYEISEQVGYKNIDYFNLKFKKYTGLSPTEYKKKYVQMG